VPVLTATALAGGVRADAQMLPSGPVVFADGHVTVGANVSATYSCAWGAQTSGCGDDTGFFNYSEYESSLLRQFRLDLSASVTAGKRVSLLTEIRTDNFQHVEPYALYVRIRPWPDRRFDVQAGRIPPTFGAFSRRFYPSDNLLIGYPLAYQYLTSLRPDALPASADELLRMRGRGWLSSFSIGNPAPAPGLPLINGLAWDTGVQAHAATDVVDLSASLTTGTLTEPLVRENNAGKQISGRVSLQPIQGLVIGASGAHGPFAARSAILSAGLPRSDQSVTQSALEADIEYSRGYYLVRMETIASAWQLPVIGAPALEDPLRAFSTSIEGKYRIRPGFYAAARWDHLAFSEITGNTARLPWEAPITRVEAGIGYSLRRNVLLKASYQHNDRDGGRVTALSLGSVQLVYWF
jgi:hypothetical protein